MACDLLFYKTHIVFQMCDQCIVWSAAQEIPGRAMRAIIDACQHCWVIYEAAKVLHSDGEGALSNDSAKDIQKNKGT